MAVVKIHHNALHLLRCTYEDSKFVIDFSDETLRGAQMLQRMTSTHTTKYCIKSITIHSGHEVLHLANNFSARVV